MRTRNSKIISTALLTKRSEGGRGQRPTTRRRRRRRRKRRN
jgi:hypothetical protein